MPSGFLALISRLSRQRHGLSLGCHLCRPLFMVGLFVVGLWMTLFTRPVQGYSALQPLASNYQQVTRLPTDDMPPLTPDASPTGYGAAPVVGESLEPCETTFTRPTAVVLTPASPWQSALRNATPGSVFLLRGGLYGVNEPLRIAAGVAGQVVIVKPYNCEVVTLRGGLQLQSYTFIAGMRIEGALPTQLNPSYTIRIDGKTVVQRAITIRNNTIVGGETDAIRINDKVINVRLSGNQIDGGKGGHNLFVTTEVQPIVTAQTPTNIVITNNRLTKVYFRDSALPSEDMFQVRDARTVKFLSNSCENGSRMEQCVDIKSVTAPLIIQGNFFDGATLHQDGAGEDIASGCMVIHEFDNHPDLHVIEGNYFNRCRTTIIRFASEGGAAYSSAIVRNNVFVNDEATDNEALLIWRSENVRFEDNTMIRGTLKLGRGSGLDQNPPVTPKNTILKNNLFYRSRIDDNTRAPDFIYQCRHNLFYQLLQQGNRTLQCTNALTNDPHLTLLDTGDYRPAASSPACRGGENGTTIGALACQSAATQTDAEPVATEPLTWYEPMTNPEEEDQDANATAPTAPVSEDAPLLDTPDNDTPSAVDAELERMELIYQIYLPVIQQE